MSLGQPCQRCASGFGWLTCGGVFQAKSAFLPLLASYRLRGTHSAGTALGPGQRRAVAILPDSVGLRCYVDHPGGLMRGSGWLVATRETLVYRDSPLDCSVDSRQRALPRLSMGMARNSGSLALFCAVFRPGLFDGPGAGLDRSSEPLQNDYFAAACFTPPCFRRIMAAAAAYFTSSRLSSSNAFRSG